MSIYRIVLTAIGVMCGGLSLAHAEEGPSFNCAYAKAPDEVLICQNEELAAQDREMASDYSWGLNNFKRGFRAYLSRHKMPGWRAEIPVATMLNASAKRTKIA